MTRTGRAESSKCRAHVSSHYNFVTSWSFALPITHGPPKLMGTVYSMQEKRETDFHRTLWSPCYYQGPRQILSYGEFSRSR